MGSPLCVVCLYLRVRRGRERDIPVFSVGASRVRRLRFRVLPNCSLTLVQYFYFLRYKVQEGLRSRHWHLIPAFL